ncbi:MAG: right-handed parallel beta-helix repeat-containing protein [Phycisphaerae bacterium]|nr:right-handed parallel beta-helix repeat-containing protein [Phycisphaerae bacterium]
MICKKLDFFAIFFALLLISGIFSEFPNPSYGADIFVPTGTSIQTGIDTASDGDIVIVAPGTYAETIDFKGKKIIVQSSDPANDSIVENTIIDCSALSDTGVLFITGETIESQLNGFTITNGKGYWGWAGAILIAENSGATIRNCIISGHNTTTNAGAISCESSEESIFINCKFSNNHTKRYGGAIYCISSKVSFYNCDFIGNSVELYSGGALYFYNDCEVELTDCYFEDNSASAKGGAIFLSASTITIIDSYLVENNANYGGGIYCYASNGRIDNSVINGNESLDGGGIYLESNSKPEIYNCVLAGNKATNTQAGGALHCITGSNPKVRNSIIWNNKTRQIAAPYAVTGTPDIKYCYVTGGWGIPDPDDGSGSEWDHNLNPIDDDPGFSTAGSWDVNVWVEVEDIKNAYRIESDSICFDTGESQYAPAFDLKDIDSNNRFCDEAVDIGINELNPGHKIYNENNEQWYSDIQNAMSQATLGDIITINPGLYISDYRIDFKAGTTLQSRHPDKMDFRDNTVIKGNELSSIIYFGPSDSNESLLDGLTLANNSAENGGAINIFQAQPTIRRCIIRDNVAVQGGGIYCQNTNGIKIEKCIIKNNIAYEKGGAIVLEQDNFILDTFTLDLSDSVIVGNTSEDAAGGIYCGEDGTFEISRCTIKKNYPYAIEYMGVWEQSINNSIIWNNALAEDETEQLDQFLLFTKSAIVLSNCNIQGGWENILVDENTDYAIISTDPIFQGYTDEGDPDDPNDDKFVDHDYILKSNSPCINGGDLSYQDETTFDIDGNIRLSHCCLDIGAWEHTEPILSGTKHLIYNQSENSWHCTIQDAVDESEAGNTIIIGPGVYNENIVIEKANLVLKGRSIWERDVVSNTTIDGQSLGPVIQLVAEKAGGTEIRGISMRNGANEAGGGITSSKNDNIKIRNCNILNNKANSRGGGIYLSEAANSTVDFCLLGDNDSSYGGGLYADMTDNLNLNNNFIISNIANDPNNLSRGGGVFISTSKNVKLDFCTIYGNATVGSVLGSAIYLGDGITNADINNSIVWGNVPAFDHIFDIDDAQTELNYCDIEGGWLGETKIGKNNINIDPDFVYVGGEEEQWDWHLNENSPCVNAGDPTIKYLATQTDYDGNARYLFGRVDIGADEMSQLDPDNLSNVVKNETKNTWFNTIQKAIDAAASKDVLIVMPGVYKENIKVHRQGLTLKTVDPQDKDIQATTIILGTNGSDDMYDSTITMPSGLAKGVTIDGFTVICGTGYFNDKGNTDPNDDETFGGGVYSINNNEFTLRNCLFLTTSNVDVGGAIYIDASQTKVSTIEKCWFGFFQANKRGGAIALDRCYDFNIKNNLITDCHSTADDSSSIDMQRSRRVEIINCTIHKSDAVIAWDSCYQIYLRNSILWGDMALPAIADPDNKITAEYNNIQGAPSEINHNIDTDPLFANTTNVLDYDFHLRSTIGRWDWQINAWVQDALDSPCIDTGKPEGLAWQSECWPNGQLINMGSYGGTPRASLSTSSDNFSVADVNYDNVIDILDFTAVLDHWLDKVGPNIYDRNNDGHVNLYEIAILQFNWLLERQ